MMSVKHPLPGTFKCRSIQGAVKAEMQDDYINLRRIGVDRVKQHALLHWRKRVDGLDIVLAHACLYLEFADFVHEIIKFPLAQIGFWKIGWGKAACGRRLAVANEFF